MSEEHQQAAYRKHNSSICISCGEKVIT